MFSVSITFCGREAAGTNLDAEQVVPPLDEVSRDVAGRLSDNLHGYIVPIRSSSDYLRQEQATKLTMAFGGPSHGRTYPHAVC